MIKKDQMIKGTIVQFLKQQEFLIALTDDPSQYFNVSSGNCQDGELAKIGDEFEVLVTMGEKDKIIGLLNKRTGYEGWCYWADFRKACNQISAIQKVAPKPAKVLKANELKKGYYISGVHGVDKDVTVSYCTGVRGGGGHCYIRTDWKTGKFDTTKQSHSKFDNGWVTLHWNCHGNGGVYSATCPSFIKDWK